MSEKLIPLIKGNDLSKIKGIFKKSDVDINYPVQNLYPIHHAVIHKRVDILKYFVSIGANIDAQSEKYEGRSKLTALMLAGLQKSKDVVLYLLNRGADPLCKDKAGETVLDILSAQTSDEAIDNICSVIEVFITKQKEEKEMVEKRGKFLRMYSDFTLVCSDGEIETFKIVLWRSPVLRKSVMSEKKKKLKDVDVYTVSKCVDFLFGKEPGCKISKLYSVFKLARRWKLPNCIIFTVNKVEKLKLKALADILKEIAKDTDIDPSENLFLFACYRKLQISYPKALTPTNKHLGDVAKILPDILTLPTRKLPALLSHADVSGSYKPLQQARDLFRSTALGLWRKRKLTDCLLYGKYPVHRIMLILNSGYFFNVFQSDPTIRKKRDLILRPFAYFRSEAEMHQAVQFLYTHKLPGNDLEIDTLFKFLTLSGAYLKKIVFAKVRKVARTDPKRKARFVQSVLESAYFVLRDLDEETREEYRGFWGQFFPGIVLEQIMDQSVEWHDQMEYYRRRIKSNM